MCFSKFSPSNSIAMIPALQAKSWRSFNQFFLSFLQIRNSNSGTKLRYTADPNDQRYLPEPFRKFFADVLNLKQYDNPMQIIDEAKSSLRNGRSESEMRAQLAEIYPELGAWLWNEQWNRNSKKTFPVENNTFFAAIHWSDFFLSFKIVSENRSALAYHNCI